MWLNLIVLFLLSSTAFAQSLPPLGIQDEGGTVGRPVLVLDCVGTGVSCSKTGTTGTITVSGGAVSMPLSYLTVSGQSTLSGDVTIGSASTTYFSAQPDLGVKGALEVDGGIYAMSTLSALGTGNVGIGTTNPTQKLSVTGSVTISADLYCGTAKATTGYRNLCIDSTGKIFSVSSASTCGAGT
jgi:hypothetical protein